MILFVFASLIVVQANERFLDSDSLIVLRASGTSFSFHPTTTTTTTSRAYIPSYHSYTPSIGVHAYLPSYHSYSYSSGGSHFGIGGIIAIVVVCVVFILLVCCFCGKEEPQGVVETTTVTTVVQGGNGPQAVQVPPPFPAAYPGGPVMPRCKNQHQMNWVQGNPYSLQGDDGPVCDSCNIKFDYMRTFAHCYSCSDDLCFNCAPGQVR